MKILITGIGIVGKSTLRRQLTKMLRKRNMKVRHYDADKFEEIRHNLDISCLKKLPSEFDPNTTYIIEDVHATMAQAVLPLEQYDLIIYLKVGWLSQILFWLPRMKRWFASGHYSWEAEIGWHGNGRPKSLGNLPGIIKDLIHDVRHRRKWIKEDLNKLKILNNVYIGQSVWKKSGPQFVFKIKPPL
jgi:GTPase SAR1 family protein